MEDPDESLPQKEQVARKLEIGTNIDANLSMTIRFCVVQKCLDQHNPLCDGQLE